MVLVDDGSTDDTVEIAKSFTDGCFDLTVVPGPGRGPGAARNAGVRAATTVKLLCCDADDVVCPEWVRVMSDGLENADLVGGPLDDAALNSELVRSAHRNPFGAALQAPAGYLPYAPSGNLGFHKAAFESVGGFDESLRTSAEDIDLSWRAQEAGFILAFVPEAVVQCRYRSSLYRLCRQQYRYALGFAVVYARRVGRGLMPAQTREWQRRTLVSCTSSGSPTSSVSSGATHAGATSGAWDGSQEEPTATSDTGSSSDRHVALSAARCRGGDRAPRCSNHPRSNEAGARGLRPLRWLRRTR